MIQNTLRGLFAASALSLCAIAAETTAPVAPAAPTAKPLSAEQSMLITAVAKVKAIDYQTRQVTLIDEDGQVTSFVAGKQIERLNDVMVGDLVQADYYISIAGELRAPTAEEAANPLVILEDQARAAKEEIPAGAAIRVIRAVTTVQTLDLISQSLTLMGPAGNLLEIRAKHPENLKKLRLGDIIVVTYTEALAISLKKIAPAAAVAPSAVPAK